MRISDWSSDVCSSDLFQGQLVADLTQARTESQLKAMLDQILRQVPVESAESQTEAELETLIAMGEQILGEDPACALSIFDQLIGMAPDPPAVVSGRLPALNGPDRGDGAEVGRARKRI